MCLCSPGLHDVINVPLCSECHYSCDKCDSPTRSSCVSCVVNSFRTLSPLKECLCNSRFIDVVNDKICGKCHYSCLSCSEINNAAKCITCSPADVRVFNVSANTCDCQIGFFDVANTNKCGTCHYSC